MERYGVPEHIRSDNGPEFIAYAIQDWMKQREIKSLYIKPGSPWENGHIESFWPDPEKRDILKIEFCLIERPNGMKKSKFSEEQVVGILREGQSGMAVKALCAKHNISEPIERWLVWRSQIRPLRAHGQATVGYLLCSKGFSAGTSTGAMTDFQTA
jgi:hypothetical protein